MSEWQDISTAPKDGTIVELRRDHFIGMGYYGLRSPDAPVFQPTPPDPLGGTPILTPEQERENIESARTSKQWVREGGQYLFPEPTHWRPR